MAGRGHYKQLRELSGPGSSQGSTDEVWVEPGAISLMYKGSCRGARATINLPETIFNLLRCNIISANDRMPIPVFVFFF